jgi:hypothetical protein
MDGTRARDGPFAVGGRRSDVNALTCDGCGNPLECFEGEVYCPDCTRFEPADAPGAEGGEASASPPGVSATTGRDLDRLCLQYLDAIDRQDFDALAALWDRAAADPALEIAFHELHEALNEEDGPRA